LFQVLGELRYRHLLDGTIHNLGFIYEEGDSNFTKKDTNRKLTNLGILNLHRWSSGISVIHFVFPSKQQANNTRTTEGHHDQATFLDFARAMQKYWGPEIRFQFYAPDVNHYNYFVFVLNGTAAKNTVRQSILTPPLSNPTPQFARQLETMRTMGSAHRRTLVAGQAPQGIPCPP
jgi:hypothetical protein